MININNKSTSVTGVRGRFTYSTRAVLAPSDVQSSRKAKIGGQSTSRAFSDMLLSFSRVWQRREQSESSSSNKVEDLALRTAERAKQVRSVAFWHSL